MDIFSKLFSSLNKEGVIYMVAGGIAVNLYGIERATADIDIVLLMDHENLLRFTRMAEKLGLKPKIPVALHDFLDPEKRREWLTEKNLVVFSLYDPESPFFLLDVIIETPFDFNEVYTRKKQVEFRGVVVPVVPLDDLISMKENTNRPQDVSDVYYLRRIKELWEGEE